jgi:hypothetical protein
LRPRDRVQIRIIFKSQAAIDSTPNLLELLQNQNSQNSIVIELFLRHDLTNPPNRQTDIGSQQHNSTRVNKGLISGTHIPTHITKQYVTVLCNVLGSVPYCSTKQIANHSTRFTTLLKAQDFSGLNLGIS